MECGADIVGSGTAAAAAGALAREYDMDANDTLDTLLLELLLEDAATRVRACADAVGLALSDGACEAAAECLFIDHMPDTPSEMIAERFILPLARAVAHEPDMARVLEHLRKHAPASGVVEYISSLSSAALQHVDVGHWTQHFLVSKCRGSVPPQLDGWRRRGKGEAPAMCTLSRGGRVVALFLDEALASADANATAAGALSSPFEAAVDAVMGACPPDCTRIFHATTAFHVESVIAWVQQDYGRSDVDFGRGFYTFAHAHPALQWALTKQIFGWGVMACAAVVVWQVPQAALSGLVCTTLTDNDEFRDVVYNWRFLQGSERDAFENAWMGRASDVVEGPVALSSCWDLDMGYEDIGTLAGAASGAEPALQRVFRTRAAVDVLRRATQVCGVVLAPHDAVLKTTSSRRHDLDYWRRV